MNENDLKLISIELSFEALVRSRAIFSILGDDQKERYREAHKKEAKDLFDSLLQRVSSKDAYTFLQTISQNQSPTDDQFDQRP